MFCADAPFSLVQFWPALGFAYVCTERYLLIKVNCRIPSCLYLQAQRVVFARLKADSMMVHLLIGLVNTL
jgi:hypothetical protein